jgi:ParB family chromosome partitioning protein
LLALPQEMQDSVSEGKMSEGHTRPLLMLADRPEEQQTLYKEILIKRMTVRDAENIARKIAFDRVRKKEYLYAPELLVMERELGEALGTRVAIETKENGGKLTIDFVTEEDLRNIFSHLASRVEQTKNPQSQPIQENSAPLDDRSREEIQKDENTFDPSSFSI